MTVAIQIVPGVTYYPGWLPVEGQRQLLQKLEEILVAAPLFQPTMPRTGKPFSVQMSNCGSLGWVSDRQGGYRYQATHPQTGAPWPEMPKILQTAWTDLAHYAPGPQACLINYYKDTARMGLHQDRDEADFDAPVLSLSLGDTGLFRIGGQERSDKTKSLKLQSGDVLVFGGPARLAFHGIDRIMPGTSTLLPNGGRINLTLRRVDAPPA
ncbi:MAG: alpha-ketoglutarate-dependent dioxygenase AlkB [Hyphomicrobiales bacterium]|nr:alpha-ketoglutarate-dependent dioxygenase AlkB [Hyphomicrobiales bacterium]MDE2114818.1 alpha-ketoglutarate-dependent dioxygenase AlkB [Hyphomicrobiales bacterium]